MSNSGFTKIDILIFVLAVIIACIMDGAVIYYLNNKTADIQVLTEVSQIRSGLDVYLQANNFYPPFETPTQLNDSYIGTEKLCLEGFKRFSEKCKRLILDKIPNIFRTEGIYYTYQSLNNNQDYKIEFVLKTNFKNQGLTKGKNCATNSQIFSQPCF